MTPTPALKHQLADLYLRRSSLERQIADIEAVLSPRRRPVGLCGTEGGYYRHIRTIGEPACRACKNAHADNERARRAKRSTP